MKNIIYGKSIPTEISKKLSATSGKYSQARLKRESRGTTTSCELIWERVLKEFHSNSVHLGWSVKDKKLMKLILKRLPEGFDYRYFLEVVIEHWIPIVSGAFKQYPTVPQIPFLSRFLHTFTEFYTSLTIDGLLPQPKTEIKAQRDLSSVERLELDSLRKLFKNSKPLPKKRKKLRKINTHVANVSNAEDEFGDYSE